MADSDSQILGFGPQNLKNAISSSMLLVLIQNFLHFQDTGIYIKQILDIN